MSYFAFLAANLVYSVKGKYISKFVTIFCLLQVLNTQIQTSTGEKPVSFYYNRNLTGIIYSQPGDINIGEIANIYRWKTMINCTTSTHSTITDPSESTKFAVDWVNKNPNLLPNVTMGFIIRGTCASLPMTLANSLYFLPRTERICNESKCYTQHMTSSSDSQYVSHDVIGMLAPYWSALATVVSNLNSMVRLPSVGYEAGSDELTSTKYHPYFFRVNTPDRYQISSILKFASDNGWSYIQFVYEDDYYGRDARKSMYDLAPSYGVCIAASHVLITYQNMAESMITKPRARAVVIFMAGWRFYELLKQVKYLGYNGHFIWIGSSRMQSYRMAYYVGIGTFLVFPYTKLVREYVDYLKNIDIFETKNPWLKKNWEKKRRCTYAKCPPKKSEKLNYNRARSASLRMDAVLVFAHSAHKLLQDHCPGARGKAARACITGELLSEYLKKTKLDGFNGLVEFNENQEIVGNFTVMQLKYGYKEDDFYPITKKRAYVEDVAIYDSKSNRITYLDQPISWSNVKKFRRIVPLDKESLVKEIPESICSRPCIAGEYKIEKDLPCCWDCLKCREKERLIKGNTGCEACPLFQWPDPMSKFTTCVDIPLTYQTIKDPIPMVLVSVAIFVLILTLLVFSAYVKYRNKRVIKASSKELSFIQHVGISGGYITVILFQTTPTDIMCRCIFFIFCMSFAMLYSPLLVKTVRIFRIFRSASAKKKPRFINPQSQLLITVLLIKTQLLLYVAIYLLYMPGARRTQPIWSEKMVELTCDFTIPGLSSFLGSTILLVSLCAAFAFMVRKLPDNYNESRFITMCVSAALLIWMAFVPTYFTADREYMRMFLLCMALILNHSVALIILFFPRIYAAMFLSDESLNFAVKK